MIKAIRVLIIFLLSLSFSYQAGATYFENTYNIIPYTGNPDQLRIIDQWGYYLNLADYDPAEGDEVGAFWNNGTDIILVGMETITSYMAANDFYIGLDIYGNDPDSHTERSDGMEDGADIFYRVYELTEAVEWNVVSDSVFAAGEINQEHDLNVQASAASDPIIDFNGDGTSDIVIFRSNTGLWAVRGITRAYFGSASDQPVPADYSGSGTTDIGIYRNSSGLWAIRNLTRFYFGSISDHPVPGDYSGDGCCDAGIFREEGGLWALRGLSRIYFGALNDEPVHSDFNGNGTKGIGIFRSDSGLWAIRDITRLYFGSSGDQVIPGDYDGDGTWTPGIFRAASGLWAIRGTTRVYFGSSADKPVTADYLGDGKNDIGIFRVNSGLWAIRNVTRVYYGSFEDIPITE